MGVSADYIIQQQKGIKKSFDNASQYNVEKLMNLPIFNVQVTDEFSEIFTSTESLTGTRQLAEQETPDVLKLGDGYSVTLTSNRFGGAIEVTTTMRRKFRDSTTKADLYLTRQRDQLIKSNNRLMATDLHVMLNQAFVSTTSLAPDGAVLCGTHTWNSGATFNNSTTAILDIAAVDAAEDYAGQFVDAEGNKSPLRFDSIVVAQGSDAYRQAKKLFAEDIVPTTVADINIYQGGSYTIYETPYIDAANRAFWFMLDSSEISPLYMGVNQMPTLSEPIPQNNGAIRTNVEGFWSRGINNMPMFLYGSNGTV